MMQNNNENVDDLYFSRKFYLLKSSNYLFIANLSNIVILNYILSSKDIIFSFYQTINLGVESPNFISKKINYSQFKFYNEHIYEDNSKIICFKNDYIFIINKNNQNLGFQVNTKIKINPNYINYEVYKIIYFFYITIKL